MSTKCCNNCVKYCLFEHNPFCNKWNVYIPGSILNHLVCDQFILRTDTPRKPERIEPLTTYDITRGVDKVIGRLYAKQCELIDAVNELKERE